MQRGAARVFPSATRRPRLVTPTVSRHRLLAGTRNTHVEASSDGSCREDSTPEKETTTHDQTQHQTSTDTMEPDSFSSEFEHRVPSNQAHPALSDENLHSGADPQHPKRPEKDQKDPDEVKREESEKEDVRRHNEDMQRRHSRAWSQVTQEGTVTPLDDEGDAYLRRKE